MKTIVLFKQISEEYQNELNKINFSTVFIEPLQFVFVNLDKLKEKLCSSSYKALILTSPRAIEAVSKIWSDDLRDIWKEKNVFTVGKASANQIRTLLNLDSVGSQTGNASNLADYILENYNMTGFIFPCGNLKADILLEKLKNSTVEAFTVYETEENINLENNLTKVLASGDSIFGYVFFSPSGVNFVSKYLNFIPLLNNFKMFAIGNTTAKEMKKIGLPISGVAERPDAVCLVDTITKSEDL